MPGRRGRASWIIAALALIGAGLGIGVASSGATDPGYEPDKQICLRRAQAVVSSCPGRLLEEVDADFRPRALSDHAPEPVSVTFSASIRSEDGDPPPGLRRVEVDFDRAGAIDFRSIPACPRRSVERLSIGELRRRCAGAMVGVGSAGVGTAASSLPLALTLFNGGQRNRTAALFIRASGWEEAPSFVPVEVIARRRGPYGLRAVADIPALPAARGSVLSFEVEIRRLFELGVREHGYVSASCPRKSLQATVRSTFRDGATISGTVIRPCSARP